MMIDLTGIAVSITGGVFSVLGIVAAAIINSHVQDAQARTTLNTAVGNSLGAMEQAATAGIDVLHPTVAMPPGVPAELAVGVGYVLAHAGDEATRLGITPQSIASKIDARLGLAKLAARASAVVPAPASVPVAGPATRGKPGGLMP